MTKTDFEAESPKAHATRLYNELFIFDRDKAAGVSKLAQAFREWEARGLESFARMLEGLTEPVSMAVHTELLSRAKELRGRAIDVA